MRNKSYDIWDDKHFLNLLLELMSLISIISGENFSLVAFSAIKNSIKIQ